MVGDAGRDEACYVIVERGTHHDVPLNGYVEMLDRLREQLTAACEGPGFDDGEVTFRQEAHDGKFPLFLSRTAAESNQHVLDGVCEWYQLLDFRAGIVDTLPHIMLLSWLCEETGRDPKELIAEAFSRLPPPE